MTTALAIDYSFARPAPAAIKAAGYSAVFRYLSGGGSSKDLTAAEATALHEAGLGIGLVWETTGNRALDGAAAGTADGKAAAAQAGKLGLPHGAVLLVNVGDFAATEAQLGVIEAYYHAFRAQTGHWQTGGYATSFIISGLVARGAQGLWWQNAMDDAGTPGSAVNPHASLYQRVKPTRTIAGAKASDFDEDAYGFGPVLPAWWVTRPGAYRHVADGTKSLAEIAEARGTTVAHIADVSMANMSKGNQERMRAYLAGHAPDGLVYWTSAP